jgi:hypothetical protein
MPRGQTAKAPEVCVCVKRDLIHSQKRPAIIGIPDQTARLDMNWNWQNPTLIIPLPQPAFSAKAPRKHTPPCRDDQGVVAAASCHGDGFLVKVVRGHERRAQGVLKQLEALSLRREGGTGKRVEIPRKWVSLAPQRLALAPRVNRAILHYGDTVPASCRRRHGALPAHELHLHRDKVLLL